MTEGASALLNKFRVPVGPLMADLILAASLIFTAGQMTQRFEAMDKRIAKMEEDKLAQRAEVSERRLDMVEESSQRQRVEIISRLDRIEDKLDSKQDRVGR
jgi:hypothetical protein